MNIKRDKDKCTKSFCISVGLAAEVDSIAKAMDLSVSQIVRRNLEQFVNEYKKNKLKVS